MKKHPIHIPHRSDLSTRQKVGFILLLTGPLLLLSFFEPPIAQSEAYHQFADQRNLLGIPNFYNVVSNAAFLLVGILGLQTIHHDKNTPTFVNSAGRWPYIILFWGIAFTSFGSAFYHLNPNTQHLVWDRLPMTLAFMSLFAAVIIEYIDFKIGLRLLPILIIMGVASIVYWYIGIAQGGGDLRFYVDVQFYPLITIPLILYFFPSSYTHGRDMMLALLFYALAKLSELSDGLIFELFNRALSGHTLKHLLAASATLWLVWMLMKRQPKPNSLAQRPSPILQTSKE